MAAEALTLTDSNFKEAHDPFRGEKALIGLRARDVAILHELNPDSEHFDGMADRFLDGLQQGIDTGAVAVPEAEERSEQEVLIEAVKEVLVDNMERASNDANAILREQIATLERQLAEAKALISADVLELQENNEALAQELFWTQAHHEDTLRQLDDQRRKTADRDMLLAGRRLEGENWLARTLKIRGAVAVRAAFSSFSQK